MPERVGFIGVGTMGKHMAANILAAGFPLVVYDRQNEALEHFRSLGAQIAGSAAEVARQADIVEIAVAPQAAVEEVALGSEGLMDGARAGMIIDIHSTAEPAALQRITEEGKRRGVSVLDAQMTGGDRRAQAGTLCFMVGGDKEALERCRPVLNVLGNEIYHVGAVGTGSLAKIAHNAIIAVTILANADGFAFAERAGVDPEVFQEIVRHGSAQSHVGDDWLERWSVTGTPNTYKWVLESILDIGEELGLDLPAAALAKQQIPVLFAPK
jgi:3-hydroxyisobutyrate dehydrogenase-like beta-hydroxyacid dehydrogenase